MASTRAVVRIKRLRAVVRGKLVDNGGGSSDHATLTNRSWTASGHIGTASTLPYFNASNVASLATLTAAGLALLDDANAAAQRTTLQIERSQTLTDQATITCDWSQGEVATVTLGGARTIAMSGGTSGRIYTLRIVQDGTGDRSLEYGAEVPVKPEHRRQANQVTVHQFVCDGSAYHLVGPSPWMWLACTTLTQHRVAATWAAVTGCQWTPVPSAVYEVAVRLTGYAAATSTGIALRITTGGATDGAGTLTTQGASIATSVVRHQGAPDTAGVIGASVTSTTAPRTPVWGHMIFRASASPSACGPEISTEVDGSQVSIASGVSGIYIRRLA